MTELSFANSQLEVLKEELEGINSTLDVYQYDRWVGQTTDQSTSIYRILH